MNGHFGQYDEKDSGKMATIIFFFVLKKKHYSKLVRMVTWKLIFGGVRNLLLVVTLIIATTILH